MHEQYMCTLGESQIKWIVIWIFVKFRAAITHLANFRCLRFLVWIPAPFQLPKGLSGNTSRYILDVRLVELGQRPFKSFSLLRISCQVSCNLLPCPDIMCSRVSFFRFVIHFLLQWPPGGPGLPSLASYFFIQMIWSLIMGLLTSLVAVTWTSMMC